MIITILGADFSASNIGTLSSYLVRYTGNVTGNVNSVEKNDAGTAAKAALTATITMKSGFTYESLSVTVGGSTITGYTAKDNGNGTVSLTVPANLITGTVVVSVVTTGTSVNPPSGGDEGGNTGGGSGETPSIPTTETWYIDHRNNVSKFSASVNIAGRGWCHIPNSNGYNAIVGKPINTIGVITNLETQNITIGVVTYKGNDTAMRTIGTYTLTNPNGTTKSFVSCKIDEVTLNNNECLALYAQEDDSIQFYYLSNGGPVTDANGIADGNFAGRVPKVYGAGTAWTEYTNALTLGISYGYIPE
jgi:hypothetical protein